jgi:hypothetical protein
MQKLSSFRCLESADEVKLVKHTQDDQGREGGGNSDNQDGKGIVGGGEHQR